MAEDVIPMGQSTSLEVAGLLPLRKQAAPVDSLLKALHYVYEHPRASGAVIGGAIGALTSPEGETKKETARNTVGSLLGGALSGAIVASAVSRKIDPNETPLFNILDKKRSVIDTETPYGLGTRFVPAPPLKAFSATLLTSGLQGPAAGRSFVQMFAPTPAPPESLVGILGNKKRYSDKDLFEKYTETKNKGELSSAQDKKFVGALRDLYQHADKALPEAPSVKSSLKKGLGSMLRLGGNAALMVNAFDQPKRDALVGALPAAIQIGAELGTNLRRNFIDKGVIVADKDEAKTRASFSDAQLRRLLQGLRVEQVRGHSIK